MLTHICGGHSSSNYILYFFVFPHSRIRVILLSTCFRHVRKWCVYHGIYFYYFLASMGSSRKIFRDTHATSEHAENMSTTKLRGSLKKDWGLIPNLCTIRPTCYHSTIALPQLQLLNIYTDHFRILFS